MKLKILSIGIVSLLCCLLISTSCVYAIGIGVNPTKIEAEIENYESIQKNITVSNPENIGLEFHVYAENESIDWIKISDPKFSLQPNQKKEVTIFFTPHTEEVGEFNTKICIVTLKSDGGFNIGSGVKIPTHITIKKTTTLLPLDPIIIALIITGLLVILICISRFKKS
ncbi:hypothetical protein FHEFKHOI_00485 [Candidatus Methanoperedenaceae archaeon GB50]|nr:hypothetical protein AIOGIFDO_00484 [Candidatus Methanoperedenaceae archaeon GB37]CAD7769041.1 hypothetical protein FHEFKHOI_00485 [Candidatus Methanoperedenaceae archaeon GB50]